MKTNTYYYLQEEEEEEEGCYNVKSVEFMFSQKQINISVVALKRLFIHTIHKPDVQ